MSRSKDARNQARTQAALKWSKRKCHDCGVPLKHPHWGDNAPLGHPFMAVVDVENLCCRCPACAVKWRKAK